MKETDFDNKLKNQTKKFTSNKLKYVLTENELNELSEKVKLISTKDYNFSLGRKYFRSDDGSQNKSTKVLNILLVGIQKEYIILNL